MEKLEQSLEIYKKAVEIYQPSAIAIMFSGGDDSLTAYHVAKRLSISLTHFIHGNTRTGLVETTDFARKIGYESGLKYLEADAGTAFEDYVRRKGFFGRGIQAHSFAYHVLKAQPFRKAVSSIRQRRRKFQVLLLCGARKDESENRKHNLNEHYNIDPAAKSNVWVNLMHDWSKADCKAFLQEIEAKRNPVTELLCRSGECMCGTMQSKEQRAEAAYWFPKWGKWLDDLEKEVCEKFSWRWGDDVNRYHLLERDAGQLRFDLSFMPACHSCVNKQNKEYYHGKKK